jgi:hypothetical protein
LFQIKASSFTGIKKMMKQHSSTPSTRQNPENRTDLAPELHSAEENEPDYIAGFHLVILMSSLTMVTFLMLLDASIIATVRSTTQDQ